MHIYQVRLTYVVNLDLSTLKLNVVRIFVVSCPEKILTWPDRLGILIEIAKAVHFLHTGVIPGSFNNQLKTNNILLDQHKIAKLSDYGVSAILEENEKLEVCSFLS